MMTKMTKAVLTIRIFRVMKEEKVKWSSTMTDLLQRS